MKMGLVDYIRIKCHTKCTDSACLGSDTVTLISSTKVRTSVCVQDIDKLVPLYQLGKKPAQTLKTS